MGKNHPFQKEMTCKLHGSGWCIFHFQAQCITAGRAFLVVPLTFFDIHANISSNCCWELFLNRTATLSIYRGMIFNADVDQLLNKVDGVCDAGQTWKAKGQTECFPCCAWLYRCCCIAWQPPLTHEQETMTFLWN